MAGSEVVSGSLVEGIGDDVVRLFFFLIVGSAVIVAGYWFYRKRHQADESTIHVASSHMVAEVREIRNRQASSHRNGDARLRHEHQAGEITCPVCLGDTEFRVETNCGHIFCGQCMITCWETGQSMGAVRCPCCRQQVTVLLPCFSDAEMASPTESIRQVLENINRYNRRFSGEPLTWAEYLNDLPTMLRHCIAEFFSFSGLIWMFRLRVLLCFFIALLYLVSPLDIIPEAVFGFFGLLDDVFVVLLLAVYISVIYRRLITERAEAAFVNQPATVNH